jgi:spore maturation protein CgeB
MTLDIVVFGLSITSSWGNGHAATYRALLEALHQRGHKVTFLERDVQWYRDHRDLETADYCRIGLYDDLRQVSQRYGAAVAAADLVIIGSYVPDGIALADWITRHARGVTAFYDIDTPITLAGLESGKTTYLAAALIPRFDLYLSFTGGPLLHMIEDEYGSPRARVLYCAAKLEAAPPVDAPTQWALGYLGTYAPDRQAALDALLLGPARCLEQDRFIVAGSQYPRELAWPDNVTRVEHLPPNKHTEFYRSQRFTLNLTRQEMLAAGYSPSVRLFEAAACGVPIISDSWPGLDSLFTPGREILTVANTNQVVEVLTGLNEERRRDIAAAARQRLLTSHTPLHRARQLEDYYQEVIAGTKPIARLEVVA